MTTLYKLTDGLSRTRVGCSNQTLWAVGVTNKAMEEGTTLCTRQVIHAYFHPVIAVLLNPIHAEFDPDNMKLWEAEGEVVSKDRTRKCGVKELTIIKELPLPKLTTEQKLRIAMLCTKEVCSDPIWNIWADAWLGGDFSARIEYDYIQYITRRGDTTPEYGAARIVYGIVENTIDDRNIAYCIYECTKKDIDLIKIIDSVMKGL